MNKKYKFIAVAMMILLVLILGGRATYKLANRNVNEKQEKKSTEDITSEKKEDADNESNAGLLFGESSEGSVEGRQKSISDRKNDLKDEHSASNPGTSSDDSGQGKNQDKKQENVQNKNQDKEEDQNKGQDQNQGQDENQDEDQLDLTEGGKWTKYY